MLHHTENMKFCFHGISSNVSKTSLACSPLFSPCLGWSWEPKVYHTSLCHYEISKVLVNTFCEGMQTVLHATALRCCCYICLTFLTCFEFLSFRYLMQNNMEEGGQNPLTSHLSSSQEVLIPRFCGDQATLWFVEVHTSLSAIREEMLRQRPM